MSGKDFLFLHELVEALEKKDEEKGGHWAEGFEPTTEIEAMMGRRVDPVEEADVRIRLRSMLDSERH